jgi:Arc/MetJ-type ribon-helix-helix transcriptional regulator
MEWERPFDFDYWVDFLKLVTVKLPEKLVTDVDQLVKAGIYHSRSDAIRAAVRDLLRRELWHTSQG